MDSPKIQVNQKLVDVLSKVIHTAIGKLPNGARDLVGDKEELLKRKGFVHA